MTFYRPIAVFFLLTGAGVLLPSMQADTIQFGGLTFTITNTESDGSASVSSDGSTLTIVGPNDGSGNPGTTDVTATAPAGGAVSFQWSFTTADPLPGFDAAGYLLAGNYTQLSDTSGETGSTQLSVSAGENFGFEASSLDNEGEPGVFTISDFATPQAGATAPEPGSSELLLVGIGAAFLGRMRSNKWKMRSNE